MQVLTANRLADGAVVFLGTNHVWRERIEEAAVFSTGAAAEEALRSGVADVTAHVVVDTYLIDVKRGAAGVSPLRLREKIRSAGPTVRTDLGKQAEKPPHRFETAA